MFPAEFDYVRPAHPEEAVGAVAQYGEDGKLLEELGDDVEHVDVDRPLAQDVDAWDDYLRLTARIAYTV